MYPYEYYLLHISRERSGEHQVLERLSMQGDDGIRHLTEAGKAHFRCEQVQFRAGIPYNRSSSV